MFSDPCNMPVLTSVVLEDYYWLGIKKYTYSSENEVTVWEDFKWIKTGN